ncbi:MAG: 16S rRNA (guanine(966)-N(2))-methyltransferase RsmD [Acidimicrobiales bacterium]
MRVVAGTAKGRRLTAPAGSGTRPTSDRVREATFNALGSLGVVEDASVLDAFAGSGALGIEALSRGASHATFLDNDPKAIAVVRGNIDAIGFRDVATIVKDKVAHFLTNSALQFDIAFFDPPYATTDEEWAVLLAQVEATTLVLEANREIEIPERLQLHRVGRYGDTVVTIASTHSQ